MFYHQGLFYILKIIRFKLISWYHNDLSVIQFEFRKTQKLIAQKYYWRIRPNIKDYMRGYKVYLTLKKVKHIPYKEL